MGNPPLLSLRFAFVFSVSLAASYATTSASLSFPRPKFRSQSAISVPKATAKDLLALLGPPQLALSVNQQEAEQLKSCFKFLVPFSPACQTQPVISGYKPVRRSLSPVRFTSKENKEAEVNELIWWPPEPVFELARLAVDSGGDPGVIHGALDPTIIKVTSYISITVFRWLQHNFVNAGLTSSRKVWIFFPSICVLIFKKLS